MRYRERHSSPRPFHASFGAESSRRIHEAGRLLGCRFLLELFLPGARLKTVFSHPVGPLAGSGRPGLKPPPCPHCSPSVLFSPKCASAAPLRERCNDKSRICGRLHTSQAGKYPRNSLTPVLLAPQPYPRLRAEPQGERFNCLSSNPTRK